MELWFFISTNGRQQSAEQWRAGFRPPARQLAIDVFVDPAVKFSMRPGK